MRILVTGSSGAIGTALCEKLAETPHDVLGADLAEPKWESDIVFKRVDLTDSSSLLPEADVIVHLAAHSRVSPVVEDPRRATENIAMTQSVLEHARLTNATVIFASTREVYGNSIRPKEEEVTLDSINPYAGSKLACESMCNSYHNCYDIPITILRIANVYGRYDMNPRVVPIFISKSNVGEKLSVFGAEKLLDFIHIDDVVDALLNVIKERNVLAGETINVGSGTGTALTKLAELINEEMKASPGYVVESNRDGEVDKYISNISKIEALLNWEPEISLEQGLSKTITWYLDHPSLLRNIRDELN